MEAADVYRKMIDRGATVRVLVPTGQGVQEAMEKVKAIAPGIDFRISDAQLNTRITLLVSDRTYFIAWQLRDDTLNDPYQAGGVATYSNMASLAESYATIFDNLWNTTEFAENLRLANAKLEEKENAMKDFIDTAAHELRTPIQPILGLAESLREMLPEPTSEQDQLLQAIIRNAKRLNQLQQDILDVSRIDGGLLKIRKEKTNLDHVLREIVADYKSQPDLVGLDLTCTSEPDLTVAVDRQRIVQVLTNLIGNAIKFSGGKSSRDRIVRQQAISVQARSVNNFAVIQVRDSGTGIDKDILPRLFTKFATKSDSGTGLGLYIARGIIERHGGKIWAENNIDGPGATFSISLPANLT
jgi:signal transduction histidine kinase